MFYRNIIQKLWAWAQSERRKPLILRGARQVGKTTAVDIFSKNFDQYIDLNLDLPEDQNLFATGRSFDDIVSAIFLHKNARRDTSKKTLLFIDEIQSAPNAVAMMRYFYEKTPELFVIAAGSLLETLIDKHINFPVGRVEYLFMYPLTFIEFLHATQEEEAITILNTVPLPDYAHEKLLKLFHQYTLLGGMPEVLLDYSENNDIVSLNSIYQNLMLAYIDDVEKYTKSSKSATIIRHAIEQAPMESGKRIKFHGFGHSNYSSKEMGEALRAIEKAMLIQLIYPTTVVTPPITSDYRKSPRLQFLDTGLINYITGLQKYFFEMTDLNTFYQGIIAEHIVGQELIALDITATRKLNFWVREKKQANAEVDFVIPYNNHIIPIEVKAGKSGTLKSLHQFIDQTEHAFGVRLYAGDIKFEKARTQTGKTYHLLSLPYYLTSMITQYITRFLA